MIYRTLFVYHTLRILIQLNWVVLAYNFNIEEGANYVRVKFKCISAYSLILYLPCYYPLHVIYSYTC
jgi:hypothetical protein